METPQGQKRPPPIAASINRATELSRDAKSARKRIKKRLEQLGPAEEGASMNADSALDQSSPRTLLPAGPSLYLPLRAQPIHCVLNGARPKSHYRRRSLIKGSLIGDLLAHYEL